MSGRNLIKAAFTRLLFASLANGAAQAMPIHDLVALFDRGACLVHYQATLPL
jgi:hypothetical protein